MFCSDTLAFVKVLFFCWLLNYYVDKKICGKTEHRSIELAGPQLKPEMVSSVFLKWKGMCPSNEKTCEFVKKKKEQEWESLKVKM